MNRIIVWKHIAYYHWISYYSSAYHHKSNDGSLSIVVQGGHGRVAHVYRHCLRQRLARRWRPTFTIVNRQKAVCAAHDASAMNELTKTNQAHPRPVRRIERVVSVAFSINIIVISNQETLNNQIYGLFFITWPWIIHLTFWFMTICERMTWRA